VPGVRRLESTSEPIVFIGWLGRCSNSPAVPTTIPASGTSRLPVADLAVAPLALIAVAIGLARIQRRNLGVPHTTQQCDVPQRRHRGRLRGCR
jgi:hypothetical protein